MTANPHETIEAVLWAKRCALCDKVPTRDDLDRRSMAHNLSGGYEVDPWTIGGWICVAGVWLCSWRCVSEFARRKV